MKSTKCASCGFVGWSDAEFCKKCGAAWATELGEMPEQPGDNSDSNQTIYYAVAPPSELSTGWAVASLVSGILNFVLLGIFVVPTIIGIIISAVALNKIKRFPMEYGGKGMAVGGLVTNIVSAVALIPLLLIAAIAIPNLMASYRAANEGTTLKALRTIHAAEQTYQATRGRGNYGSLADLRSENLISNDLASGEKWGYRWKVEVVRATSDDHAGFAVTAVPKEYGSTGRLSFFVDETGVVRGEDRQGLEANSFAPPVQLNSESRERREARRLSSY